MPTHWGVNSWNTAIRMIGKQTLFDFVKSKMNKQPEFWGRYIGSANPLTQSEVTFLKSRKCAILLIYNNLSAADVKGDKAAGSSDAQDAINAADQVVPVAERGGVWIYGNIEQPWQVNADWILGWWETMSSSSYGGAGGFYCSAHPNNTFFVSAYCSAISTTTVPNIRTLSNLYSSTAANATWKDCSVDPNTLTFAPGEPKCHPGGSVIWQYATKCFKGILPPVDQGLVDMDLANDRGFGSMWA
jgi:hypothetical protein